MPFTDQTSIAGRFSLEAGPVFDVLPNAAKTTVAREFLQALMDHAGVTEIDPRVLVKMWLLETNNGTSIRWTRDRNPAGIGIPADDTPQPFDIPDGDAAAAIFVQAVYSLVRRELAAQLPLSSPAQQWFDDVWLPKVQSPSAPPVRVVNDLGLKYKDTARDGRPRATWAWDDDYGKKLAGRFRNELAHLFDRDEEAPVSLSGLLRITQQSFRISQEYGLTEFAKQHIGPGEMYHYTKDYTLDGSCVGHMGLDIATPIGTTLFAPVDGIVVQAGGVGWEQDGRFGSKPMTGGLRIQRSNGDIVVLGHMESISTPVSTTVRTGQPAGRSGTSGTDASGAHVHVEYRIAAPGKTPSGYLASDPRIALSKGVPMATPETLDFSSLSFPVEIRFIPDRQTNQQPGIPMTPEWTTWHDTANTGRGADAEMHARYMENGCPDDLGRPTQKSWHFTVDSNRAIQHIQLNRVGWHAGDGAGPGNHSALGIEECVNSDRNVANTRQNAAELHALLIRELGLQGGTLDALVQHNHWSGKNCPATVRGQGVWPELRTIVASLLNTPAPQMPDPVPPETPYQDAIVGDGQIILAQPEGFTRALNRDVVPRQWAMPNADAVKPGSVAAGTAVEIAYLSEGTDGRMWVITTNGWRFHADAILQLDDEIPIEPPTRVGRLGAREDG